MLVGNCVNYAMATHYVFTYTLFNNTHFHLVNFQPFVLIRCHCTVNVFQKHQKLLKDTLTKASPKLSLAHITQAHGDLQRCRSFTFPINLSVFRPSLGLRHLPKFPLNVVFSDAHKIPFNLKSYCVFIFWIDAHS